MARHALTRRAGPKPARANESCAFSETMGFPKFRIQGGISEMFVKASALAADEKVIRIERRSIRIFQALRRDLKRA
jgi:hypothetical protein